MNFLETLSNEQRTDLWNRNISKEENYVFVAENNEREIVRAGICKRDGNNVDDSKNNIYLSP